MQISMTRGRLLLGLGAFAVAGLGLVRRPARASVAVPRAHPYRVAFTGAQWRARLTPAQYAVLRESGTEEPGSSPLLNEHRAGTFACAGCDNPVYDSSTKYDSGTGWPSFYRALPGAIGETRDTSMMLEVRTEVHCNRCGSHLGHVFDDGPKPTGLRYCMNGVALTFHPRGTRAS